LHTGGRKNQRDCSEESGWQFWYNQCDESNVKLRSPQCRWSDWGSLPANIKEVYGGAGDDVGVRKLVAIIFD
jgi:hypothetical protein